MNGFAWGRGRMNWCQDGDERERGRWIDGRVKWDTRGTGKREEGFQKVLERKGSMWTNGNGAKKGRRDERMRKDGSAKEREKGRTSGRTGRGEVKDREGHCHGERRID